MCFQMFKIYVGLKWTTFKAKSQALFIYLFMHLSKTDTKIHVTEWLWAALIAPVWFTVCCSLSSVRSVFRECFRSSAFNRQWHVGYEQDTQLPWTSSWALTGTSQKGAICQICLWWNVLHVFCLFTFSSICSSQSDVPKQIQIDFMVLQIIYLPDFCSLKTLSDLTF